MQEKGCPHHTNVNRKEELLLLEDPLFEVMAVRFWIDLSLHDLLCLDLLVGIFNFFLVRAVRKKNDG